MKQAVLAVLLSLLPLVVLAQAPAPAPPAMPSDPLTANLATDLHALARISALAKDLGDTRQVMLAIADADIEAFRMRHEDGTYKWASLQREEAGRVKDEQSIEQVSTEKDLKNVSVTAPNAYRLIVTVPPKRRLLTANNRVYIRTVMVDSTGFDGKVIHHDIPVNAWVAPGDSNGVALPEIGKSVKATAELGVESGNKQAVAEVALVQAKLVDDPTSPYYPAVRRLLAIRDLIAAKDMQRGQLRNAIDEALLQLPGELEKRAAEQQKAADERKAMLAAGTTKGSIAVGDATPDVVNALVDIARMLSGTLQEQTDARGRLQQLLDSLKPPAVTQ